MNCMNFTQVYSYKPHCHITVYIRTIIDNTTYICKHYHMSEQMRNVHIKMAVMVTQRSTVINEITVLFCVEKLISVF